jgi:hypothetical protein
MYTLPAKVAGLDMISPEMLKTKFGENVTVGVYTSGTV